MLGAFILKLYPSVEGEIGDIINKSYDEFIALENDDSKNVENHYKRILDEEFEKINYLKIKLNDDELKSILDEYLNSTRLFRNVYDELYSEKFNKEKTNIDEILYEANSKKYSVLTMLKEKYNVKISDDLYGNIQQALKA